MLEKYIIEINEKNIAKIRKELKAKNGGLLIYSPSLYSWPEEKLTGDADFNLFGNARIIGKNEIVASSFDNSISRHYTLRRIHACDELFGSRYDLFNVLKLNNNYIFEITGHYMVGCTLIYNKGKTFYIPKNSGLEETTLRFSIGTFIEQINKQEGADKTRLRKKYLGKMVKYAMDDLKTGKI